MSEWNKWDQPQQQPYSYDQFDQSSGKRSLMDKIFGARMAQKLRSPLFATTAILLAGAAFAGVIMMSYPGDGQQEEVPVIVAENANYKFEPQDRGGMSIAHQNNTIFGAVNGQEPFGEGAVVENLLDSEDEALDKVKAVEVSEQQQEASSEFERLAEASERAMQPQVENLAKIEPGSGEGDKPKKKVTVINIPDPDVKIKVETDKQVKVIEPLAKPDDKPLQQAAKNEPEAAPTTRPDQLHRPGSSPDTLAFVRSVLDKKDGKQAVQNYEQKQIAGAGTSTQADMDKKAAELAGLAPAAGAAGTAGAGVGGTHYVQVVSVPSEAGAETEWQKLQKSHAELGGQGYRIQQANLGERGTYYRVQVGPMSKDAANRLCDGLKAKKPGSCLVVR